MDNSCGVCGGGRGTESMVFDEEPRNSVRCETEREGGGSGGG